MKYHPTNPHTGRPGEVLIALLQGPLHLRQLARVASRRAVHAHFCAGRVRRVRRGIYEITDKGRMYLRWKRPDSDEVQNHAQLRRSE